MITDLFAQANAARVHGMIYSGFGGQTDQGPPEAPPDQGRKSTLPQT
jgi:acyl-CoA hydrolase